MFLRVLHALGLTNLTDEDVEHYERLQPESRRAGAVRRGRTLQTVWEMSETPVFKKESSDMDVTTDVLKRFWNVVASIGVMLGLFAAIISIVTFLKVDRLEEYFREARGWKVTLSLSEPTTDAEINGYITRIAGTVDFRASATDAESPPKMNLALREHKVALVPFVKPLSEAKWWWAQRSPVVHEDGSFEGSVFIGEPDGDGVGIEFQIVVLAVPMGSVSEGDRVVNLPSSNVATSDLVTVKRVK